MTINNKLYPIEDSCFYKLSNKKKLCEFLKTDSKSIKKFLISGDNNFLETKASNNRLNRIKDLNQSTYHEQEIIELDGNNFVITQDKTRLCQTPKGNKNYGLYKIHKRIADLLSSIETKEYVFSGIKGKSYIDNAKFHLDNSDNFIVKLDIKRFFPSVTSKYIFRFFRNDLKCSPDISKILTDLLAYKNHIPTGSPVSMILAYWSNFKMFDEIYKLSRLKNCKMSLWVDDIIISGEKASEVAWEAKKIIINHGLKYHDKKFKIYKPKENKEITGVIITPDGKIKLRNRSHVKIYHLKNKKDKTSQEISKLNSYLNEARQIEPNKYTKVKKNS